MPTPKQSAEAMIRSLPEDATFEDIRYKLLVLERIDEGLSELDAGRGIPHEDVKRDLARWLED